MRKKKHVWTCLHVDIISLVAREKKIKITLNINKRIFLTQTIFSVTGKLITKCEILD
jgi:hypothetical protein